MKTRTAYLPLFPLVLASVVASSCSLDAEEPELDANLEDVSEPASAGPVLDASATAHVPAVINHPECVGSERPVIFKADDGDCSLPVTYSWEVHNMFVDGTPDVAALRMSTPPELVKYCRYNYKGPEADTNAAYAELGLLADSDAEIDASTIGYDCRAFTAMAVPPELLTAVSALHDGFMANIDALDANELNNLGAEAVQVRLLDSVSQPGLESGQNSPNDLHGLQMEAIIDDIMCAGQSPCIEQSEQTLALPRRRGPIHSSADYMQGSGAGNWSDFALSVYTAVQQWRESNLYEPEHRRLILGAAVGAALTTAEEGTGPHQVAIEALQMASCYGVVVIAAAGNRSDYTCESEDGMLAPAAFESITRPTEAECDLMGYTPDWKTSSFPVRDANSDDYPLVYAIGGVQGNDETIANARPGSMPRLAATAAAAVPSGTDPFIEDVADVAITGTSVGVAVGVGTAALVWGTDPTMAPHEVLGHMYTGAHNLQVPAEDGFYEGDDVHRISVCGALESTGAVIPGCVVGPADPNGNLDGFIAEMDQFVADMDMMAMQSTHDSQNAVVENPVCQGADEWIALDTQPRKPVCGVCNADTNVAPNSNFPHALNMTMVWQGYGDNHDVTSGTLYLYGYSAADTTTLTLDTATIDALNVEPDPYPLVTVYFDHPNPANIKKAILELEYNDEYKEITAIPVY